MKGPSFKYECRGCKMERIPPIEGPCPGCKRYYNCNKIRIRPPPDDDLGGDLPDGPVSLAALLEHHKDDDSLGKRPTGMPGVDHVFDGGLPHFGAVLLCARAGTGKTSWLLELLLTIKARALFISTEQTKSDLVRQFERYGKERIMKTAKRLTIDSVTHIEDIFAVLDEVRPKVLALDSLHDVEGVTDDNGSPLAGGHERAVTRVAKEIRRWSAQNNCLSFLVGHMANDGTMMGGSHLRHAVDATLALQALGDPEKDPRRVLRFQGKTRFGRLGREALFEMTEEGFVDRGPLVAKSEHDPDSTPKKKRALKLVN